MFNNIYPSDAIVAGNPVERLEELERTSDGLATLSLELNEDAFSEGN
jgi:hypothetical protein